MSIPAGIHLCHGVAGSVQEGVSSQGTDFLAIKLRLDDLGEEVTTFLYFTEKTESWSLDRLKALGWDGKGDGNYNGIDSKQAECSVRFEQYNGKETMKVDIMTNSGVKVTPMEEKAKAGFRARLQKLASAAAVHAEGRSGFKLPDAS